MLIKLLNYLLFLFYLGCASLPSEEDRIIENFDPKIPVQKIINVYQKDGKKGYDPQKIKIFLYNFNKAIINKDIELLFSLFDEDLEILGYGLSESIFQPSTLRQEFELYTNYSSRKLNQFASRLSPPDPCSEQIPQNGNADLFRFLFYDKKIIWKSRYNQQIEYDSYRTILLNNQKFYRVRFGFSPKEGKGAFSFNSRSGYIDTFNLEISKKQNAEFKIKKIVYGQLFYIQLYYPYKLERMKEDFLKRNEKFKKEQIELGNKDFME